MAEVWHLVVWEGLNMYQGSGPVFRVWRNFKHIGFPAFFAEARHVHTWQVPSRGL